MYKQHTPSYINYETIHMHSSEDKEKKPICRNTNFKTFFII